MNDEFGLQAGFAGCLRALVAGESGVAATALPPQSKTLAGWRGLPSGHVMSGNLKSEKWPMKTQKLSQIKPDKTGDNDGLRMAIYGRTVADNIELDFESVGAVVVLRVVDLRSGGDLSAAGVMNLRAARPRSGGSKPFALLYRAGRQTLS